MNSLFTPITVGNLQLQNRFMRSATTTYFAKDDGTLKDEAITIYENLAKGRVGLIVKGHLYVMNSGKAHQGQAGISEDRHLDQLSKLTDVVHEYDSKIVAQLNHAGMRNVEYKAGPSEYEGEGRKSQALTNDGILKIIQSFGDAAQRSIQAGFDGVQIHGAHGYLVSQFLASHTNKRDDKWGGPLEQRQRFLLETYSEIRKRVGNNPIMLKLNCDDFADGGLTIDESRTIAKNMAKRGLDLLEISGGGYDRNPDLKGRALHTNPEFRELSFAGHAEKIRQVTGDMPVALVQGFTRLETMKQAIEQNLVDIISMSRPFIRESDIVRKLETGQSEVTCIRCDACSSSKVFGKTLLRCQLD